MEPYCDCEGCKERVRERLRNADTEDTKRMITILREHLAERKDVPRE